MAAIQLDLTKGVIQRVSTKSDWDALVHQLHCTFVDTTYQIPGRLEEIYLVCNPHLRMEFQARQNIQPQTSDPILAFTCSQNASFINDSTCLGLSAKIQHPEGTGGVSLQKHCDIALKLAVPRLSPHSNRLYFLMCKVLLGRSKLVPPGQAVSQPDPEFNSHSCAELVTPTDDLQIAAEKSEVFVYEYVNHRTTPRPYTILPVAVFEMMVQPQCCPPEYGPRVAGAHGSRPVSPSAGGCTPPVFGPQYPSMTAQQPAPQPVEQCEQLLQQIQQLPLQQQYHLLQWQLSLHGRFYPTYCTVFCPSPVLQHNVLPSTVVPDCPTSDSGARTAGIFLAFSFPSFGMPQAFVSLPQPSFALPQPSFGLPQPSVSVPQPYGNLSQPSVGLPQPSFGLHQPSVGLPQPSVGLPQPSVGLPQPSVGLPQPSVGLPQPSVGLPQPSVGLLQPSQPPVWTGLSPLRSLDDVQPLNTEPQLSSPMTDNE